MKNLLRLTLFNAFALFLLTQVVSGVRVYGGFFTYIFGGLLLTLLYTLLRPILNILSFPLNAITLGTFSFFVNVIILYLFTVLYPAVKISPFVFQGFSFAGFVVPSLALNSFFAHVFAAFVIAGIIAFINWVSE